VARVSPCGPRLALCSAGGVVSSTIPVFKSSPPTSPQRWFRFFVLLLDGHLAPCSGQPRLRISLYVNLVTWWSRSGVRDYARERQVGRDFDVAGDLSERLDVGCVYVVVWSAVAATVLVLFLPYTKR
jgi:hypothetical protein